MKNPLCLNSNSNKYSSSWNRTLVIILGKLNIYSKPSKRTNFILGKLANDKLNNETLFYQNLIAVMLVNI